ALADHLGLGDQPFRAAGQYVAGCGNSGIRVTLPSDGRGIRFALGSRCADQPVTADGDRNRMVVDVRAAAPGREALGARCPDQCTNCGGTYLFLDGSQPGGIWKADLYPRQFLVRVRPRELPPEQRNGLGRPPSHPEPGGVPLLPDPRRSRLRRGQKGAVAGVSTSASRRVSTPGSSTSSHLLEWRHVPLPAAENVGGAPLCPVFSPCAGRARAGALARCAAGVAACCGGASLPLALLLYLLAGTLSSRHRTRVADGVGLPRG